MKKLLLMVLATVSHAEEAKETAEVPAIPGSEIMLFDINNKADVPELLNGKNITQSPGYDSQPHFSENGELIYYTRIRAGQADIYEYVIESAINRPYLKIPKRSEYSPTTIPGERGLSVIQVDEQGDQYLVKIDNRSKLPPQRHSDLKQVGYHNWTINKEMHLWTFILNDQNGGDLYHQGSDKKAQKITTNIGRSFVVDETQQKLYFIDKKHQPWQIHVISDPNTGSQKVMELLKGTEDFTRDHKGRFWTGQGRNLYVSANKKHWTLVKQFTNPSLGDITRITTNPKGNQIAIVLDEL